MSDPNRPSPLHCLLEWEQTRPDDIYLTQPVSRDETVDYSWREVADQVRRMAAHLKSLQLPPRSQIALLGKNSAHWIMADLAIWMAGHVSVPLYPTSNAETASYILEHSEAQLLFVGKLDELWDSVAPGIPATLPLIRLPLSPSLDCPQWDDIVAATTPMADAEITFPDSDQLATIIYTSGSTGRPKGVMISFGAMAAAALGSEKSFDIGPQDRMLSYLPLAHAAERTIVQNGSLYRGFRIYFAHSQDSFLEDLRRARPTMFFSVPRLWTKFYLGVCAGLPPAKQKILFRIPILSRVVKRKILTQLGLEHTRAALTGAAPLSPDLVRWYRELGLELLEGYGMSENFAYSHLSRPGEARVGYVGTPHEGVECRIADNGEVLVKSPANMMGYFKDPEKTAEDLGPDGFLKTGDMGEIDERGRLRITGRIKELFKTSKGKYVAPAPIENRLASHPAVEAVCVTGADQPRPAALLMLSEDVRAQCTDSSAREQLESEFDALLERVNQQLESHETLGQLVVVRDSWSIDNGFLTPTMKIKRNVIEETYAPRLQEWAQTGRRIIWE